MMPFGNWSGCGRRERLFWDAYGSVGGGRSCIGMITRVEEGEEAVLECTKEYGRRKRLLCDPYEGGREEEAVLGCF